MGTALVAPIFARKNILVTRENSLYVNDILVDPDAAFIQGITDPIIGEWIGHYRESYFVDVTSRCNTACRYCYYDIQNDSKDRSIESIMQEVTTIAADFPYIGLMGAEPTVREDLHEIVSAIRSVGKHPGIYTNGIKLESKKYLEHLIEYGLEFVNYSMHFKDQYKLSFKKLLVVRNIIESCLYVSQLAFTIDKLQDIHGVMKCVDVLIDLGLQPKQFAIRAGAGIGNCTRDSGIFMSDMVKELTSKYAMNTLADSGSCLYYCQLEYRGFNMHIVRWPTNETAIYHSMTGPVFGSPLGPMLSPMVQLVSSIPQKQLQQMEVAYVS